MSKIEPTPMQPLFQELHRWACMPFVWGETDCCLVLADWIARVKGADPAAHLRGMYSTPGECERETRFLSDPVGCMARCADSIGGLPMVAVPARGDVGVYRRHGERWPYGGIWTGSLWASKGKDGVTFLKPAQVSPLACWGLGYEA